MFGLQEGEGSEVREKRGQSVFLKLNAAPQARGRAHSEMGATQGERESPQVSARVQGARLAARPPFFREFRTLTLSLFSLETLVCKPECSTHAIAQ